MIPRSPFQDPEWLDRDAFPFRSRWWEAPRGAMHYIDEGTGTPVVFVHGVPGWSFHFRDLIRRVSGHHRCIAMDHLGFGLSRKPRDWSYPPAELAANVERLIEGLGLEKVTLVVHDWGGPLGLAYAVRRSENVAAVVLFNTWLWSAKGDFGTRATTKALSSGLYRALDARFAVTARVFPRLAAGRRGALSDVARCHFEGPFRDPVDRAGLMALVRHTHASDAWVGELGDRSGELGGIPALILWGLSDPAFPRRYLDRWRGSFPQARVVELEGVGHYPFEEDAERTGGVVMEFLSTMNPAGS